MHRKARRQRPATNRAPAADRTSRRTNRRTGKLRFVPAVAERGVQRISMPVLPARLTVLIAGVFLCPAVFSATATPEILPLKEVKAGMKGTGRTVFSGIRIENFDVEILGVLENVGPKQSIILGRLSGGPLEKTGVMQ